MGSWETLSYAVVIENIVWAPYAESYDAIRAVEDHNMDIASFIEFVLEKIFANIEPVCGCLGLGGCGIIGGL